MQNMNTNLTNVTATALRAQLVTGAVISAYINEISPSRSSAPRRERPDHAGGRVGPRPR
jgi:hypothetical protein